MKIGARGVSCFTHQIAQFLFALSFLHPAQHVVIFCGDARRALAWTLMTMAPLPAGLAYRLLAPPPLCTGPRVFFPGTYAAFYAALSLPTPVTLAKGPVPFFQRPPSHTHTMSLSRIGVPRK